MSRQRALRDYVSALEGRFRRLRGSPLLVSPRDFALMLEWFERGVPLAVVTETMDRAFERAGEEGIGSLSYLRRPVESAFRSFRDARLGATGTPASDQCLPTREVLDFLARAHDLVTRAAGIDVPGGEAFERVARGLERLAGRLREQACDLEAAERTLGRLDRGLLDAARQRLGPGQVESLRREAERRLAPHREVMSSSVFERTVRREHRRLLRDAVAVPELSLFTL